MSQKKLKNVHHSFSELQTGVPERNVGYKGNMSEVSH